jgi:hypothetical protein
MNIAAMIGKYATPGGVLVSQDIVEASDPGDVVFTEIGARSS